MVWTKRLQDAGIVELPEEIGNLQFLQVLDILGNNISCLPSNVVQLRNLMRLKISSLTRVPKGLGNLRSLERLSNLSVDDSNTDILEELGQLTELKELFIGFDKWNDKLMVHESLPKLRKIQDLSLYVWTDVCNIGGLDAWVAPRCLRSLNTRYACWFSTLPAWMNPSHLSCISVLSIGVMEIQQGDLDILGKLHALRGLGLTVDDKKLGSLGEFVIGAGSFACLVNCTFEGFVRPIMFQQGAMPRLRSLWSKFSMRGGIEIRSSDGAGLFIGLGLLTSLQDIQVWLDQEGATKEEAEELKAALRHASKIHPNHPRLLIDPTRSLLT